ncbi:MAG: hypothetical protein JWM10_2916 [Myxococcaceae bacterium]|nr:hypothetical protein [Myxococcaceae bacterium]
MKPNRIAVAALILTGIAAFILSRVVHLTPALASTAWGAIGGAIISSTIGAFVKGEVDDRNSALAARRDYEYEARKRLYADVEPLLFQLHEALEEAYHRVLSLVRTDGTGNLGDGPESWIKGNGYYLSSTVYKLLLPTAYLRLMQRRVTFVDLGLDPGIELKYQLLKMYARSFTDDFVFASPHDKVQGAPSYLEERRLDYRPNHPDWEKLAPEQPAVYARQALVLGDLEGIADLLIVQEGEKARVMFFSEFERLLAATPIDDNLTEALSLFRGFSPERKPVLARMLIAQACLGRFFLSIYHRATSARGLAAGLEADVKERGFESVTNWRTPNDDRKIALAYWKERLLRLEKDDAALRDVKDTSESRRDRR